MADVNESPKHDNIDNGTLEREDITDAPVVQGTDPLSDHPEAANADGTASPQARTRSMGQLVVAGVLAVLFAGFLVNDIANKDVRRIILGVIVIGVCLVIVARELKAPKK